MGRCRRLVPRQRKFALRSGLRAQWIVDAGYEGWGVETLSFCSVVGKIQIGIGCGGDATMQDHRISQHEACRAENGRSLEYADV